MVKLPANLVFDDFWPVWVRKAGGFDGTSGGTKCVRTHMTDGDSLARSSGNCRCCGTLYLARTDATGKPAANLLDSIELSASERTSPRNESSRSVIIWSLSFK
jgi:hypothetical protein